MPLHRFKAISNLITANYRVVLHLNTIYMGAVPNNGAHESNKPQKPVVPVREFGSGVINCLFGLIFDSTIPYEERTEIWLI